MSRLFARLRGLYSSSSAQGNSNKGSELGWHAVKFVKYVCIVHVVREYVCEFSLVRPTPVQVAPASSSSSVLRHLLGLGQCVGPSMLPTFNKSGDVVLFEHLSVFAKAIQPGGEA